MISVAFDPATGRGTYTAGTVNFAPLLKVGRPTDVPQNAPNCTDLQIYFQKFPQNYPLPRLLPSASAHRPNFSGLLRGRRFRRIVNGIVSRRRTASSWICTAARELRRQSVDYRSLVVGARTDRCYVCSTSEPRPSFSGFCMLDVDRCLPVERANTPSTAACLRADRPSAEIKSKD